MRRTHSRELKLEIIRTLVSGEKRLAQVCREHSLYETLRRTHLDNEFLLA